MAVLGMQRVSLNAELGKPENLLALADTFRC